MKSILKNKKGFSLVELIITIILVFVLVSVGYLVIDAGTGNYNKGSAKTHMQQNSRILDDYIQSYLRKATKIVISSIETDLLDFTIEVDGKVAKTNGQELTADVIDDIQIRIDTSGDKAVMEYLIESEWEGETYELANSVVLNNIPKEDFDGTYINYTSIGGLTLSYSNDMLIAPTRGLDMFPEGVVRSSVFGTDPLVTPYPAEFNIFVENDIFIDPLLPGDARIEGAVGDLDVVDVVYINDTQCKVFISGNVTSTPNIIGQIIIEPEAFKFGTTELSVDLIIDEAETHHIKVVGDNEVTIPNTGEDALEYTYAFTAHDIYDDPVSGETVSWYIDDIEGSSLVGLAIDAETGVLSVSDTAVEGSFYVVAQLEDTLEEIKNHYTVDLYYDIPGLSDVMDGIVTLPFLEGDGTWNPVYVTIPYENGVNFEITGVTGEVTKVGIYAFIEKKNNSPSDFGTITLKGSTVDGQEAFKTFNVTILITGDISITPAP